MRDALLDLLCLQSAQGDVYQDIGSVAHVAYERSQDIIVMKGYQFQRAKVVAALALGVLLSHETQSAIFVEDNIQALLVNLRRLMTMGSPFARTIAVAVIADLARASDRARELILMVGFIPIELLGRVIQHCIEVRRFRVRKKGLDFICTSCRVDDTKVMINSLE